MIRKRYIIIGCVAAALLAALLIFNNRQTGTLMLVAPKNTPGGADVTVDLYLDTKHQNFTIKPGETKKVRVHAGVIRVDGSSGTMKSIDLVTVYAHETTQLQTPQAEARNTKQIGTNAKECPIIVADQVYSYSCNTVGGVIRQSAAFDLGEPLMFDSQTFSQLKPIGQGLIGWGGTADNKELDYLDLPNETIHPIVLPDAVKKLLAHNQPNIIPEDKPSASRFALVFPNSNSIYVFDDVSDNSPSVIKPQNGIYLNDLNRLLSVSFRDDTVMLFAGLAGDIDEGVVSPRTPKRATKDLPCYLFEYSPKDGKLVRTIALPKITGINHFNKLPDDFYVAEGAGTFDFYHLENDTMRLVYTINDVSSWVVSSGTLYMQASGVLYQFIPKQNGLFSLQSRLNSKDLVVSGLYNSPLGVLFTALVGRSSDAPYNIYQLFNTPQTQTNSTINTAEIDYVGFEPLLTYLTGDQLYNLKYALLQFADAQKLDASRIQVTAIDPVPHDRFSADTFDTVNFSVIIDRTNDYNAKLDYANLWSIHLNLYDPKTDVSVFDSNTLNPSPQ